MQEFDAGVPAELSSSLSDIREHRLRAARRRGEISGSSSGKGGSCGWGRGTTWRSRLPGFGAQTQPVEGARAALELPGGSIVIVTERRTLRLDPGAKEATPFARTPFFPGSELCRSFGTRRNSGCASATRTLVRYELALGEHVLLPNEGLRELPENAGEAFTTLRDGSWICAAGAGLEVRLPEGKARRFALDPAKLPWRLLPGPRIDEVWSITPNGGVTLYRILDRLYTVLAFESPRVPLDAAVTEERLALLGVKEGTGQREFGLEVFDKSGQVELDVALGGDRASVDDRWAERVLDREIALSDAPPLVALSDPRGLRVFEVLWAGCLTRPTSPKLRESWPFSGRWAEAVPMSSARVEPELHALRKLAEQLAHGRREVVTSAHLLACHRRRVRARPRCCSKSDV